MIKGLVTIAAIFLLSAEVRSETVDVKYRGHVDLRTSACLLRQSAELHGHQLKGHILSLLRTARRDLRRPDGCAVDGAVLQFQYQGYGQGWSG